MKSQKIGPGLSRIQFTLTEDLPMTATSKGKKERSPRQMLLGAIMKFASGDRGNEMCEAFAAGDTDKLAKMMDDMAKSVVAKAAKN